MKPSAYVLVLAGSLTLGSPAVAQLATPPSDQQQLTPPNNWNKSDRYKQICADLKTAKGAIATAQNWNNPKNHTKNHFTIMDGEAEKEREDLSQNHTSSTTPRLDNLVGILHEMVDENTKLLVPENEKLIKARADVRDYSLSLAYEIFLASNGKQKLSEMFSQVYKVVLPTMESDDACNLPKPPQVKILPHRPSNEPQL